MAGIGWAPALLTTLIGYLALPLRAMQWRLLLPPDIRPTWRAAFKALCLGHLGNFLLPMKGGEFVRAWALARMAPTPAPAAFVSVALVRAQDLLPVAAVIFAASLLAPWGHAAEGASRPAIEQADAVLVAGGLAALLAISAALLWALGRNRERLAAAARVALAWLPVSVGDWLRRTLASLTRGLTGPRRADLWRAQALAALCWVVFLLAAVPLLRAIGAEWGELLPASVVVTGLTTVAHLLPSAPAALGTYHAVALWALRLCLPGLDYEAALAYALTAHLIGTLSPALPGIPVAAMAWRGLVARNG
jgi:hypothetical protein